MNERSTAGHSTAAHSTAGHPGAEHASVATYVKVALILTAITVIEVVAIYIQFLAPIINPTLFVLSLAKFALVVLFFMHLRYDRRILTALFVGPMVIAIGIVLALIALIAAAMFRA